MDSSDRLHKLAEDWERYGASLHDPAWRDSMRRAVVAELRIEVERMWRDCNPDAEPPVPGPHRLLRFLVGHD